MFFFQVPNSMQITSNYRQLHNYDIFSVRNDLYLVDSFLIMNENLRCMRKCSEKVSCSLVVVKNNMCFMYNSLAHRYVSFSSSYNTILYQKNVSK